MTAEPAADLAALRARFVRLLAIEGVAGALAVVFALLYFAGHVGWGLPAFVLTLVLAAAAQVWFIARFGRPPADESAGRKV